MTDRIEIRPVKSGRELKTFIRLTDALYQDDKHYVRPLMMERKALLDQSKNPFFQHAQGAYWIADKDGAPVGRISAQIDPFDEQRTGEKIGHFGLFEAIDDKEVSKALFGQAESWLRENGCTKVQGPFNLSTNGECGLLVDGFDTPPAVMMGHARPYYEGHLIDLGFSKAKDLLAYEMELTPGPPERIRRIVSAFEKSGDYHVREINMRRYKEELRTIIDIFNDAWSENWGFVPITDAEAEHLAKEIKPLIRPERVRICEFQGEAVGMMVVIPDLNAYVQEIDGRLFPFGWARLARRLILDHPKRLRTPLMGVRKSLRRTRHSAAISLLLIEHIRRHVVPHGAEWGELSWILEDNHGMRKILEELGCKEYKTYRIFEKTLS